jgi:hypothetical protein
MTLGLWITVGATLLTVMSGLFIAFLHRRQMRQNELYRIDQSLGLKPPPLLPWSKYLRYAGVSWNLGYGVYLIVLGMRTPEPVTRETVWHIALGFASFIFGVIILMISGTNKIIDDVIDIQAQTVRLLYKITAGIDSPNPKP